MDKFLPFTFKKLKKAKRQKLKKASEIIFVLISLRFKSINPKFINKIVRNVNREAFEI